MFSADGQGSFFEVAQPLHIGHRERLRTRFRDAGAEALPDYELIELVLFRAIPRRDTKDLAKRLLARFGSFAEVVNAPDARLKEVDGVGDANSELTSGNPSHLGNILFLRLFTLFFSVNES